jgi:hypothetical protein
MFSSTLLSQAQRDPWLIQWVSYREGYKAGREKEHDHNNFGPKCR